MFRISFTFLNTHLYLQLKLLLHSEFHRLIKPLRIPSLLRLEHVDFACVFQRLSPVAEPHSNHFPVIVQLSGNLCDFLACGQSVLLEVGVQDFYRLRCETGAPLAFFGRLPTNKLHQVLLALLVPVFGFSQPLLQHRLQLLSALRGDVQLLKPATENTFYYQQQGLHPYELLWGQILGFFRLFWITCRWQTGCRPDPRWLSGPGLLASAWAPKTAGGFWNSWQTRGFPPD